MKLKFRASYIFFFAAMIVSFRSNGQQSVQKTNPMKVYMHYMPWFETPETIGHWGWHWTMNTRNPENVVDGKREIASHFYPLIGPYASRDKDVIEYHLLLMKLSGVDGILIDWYGVEGTNGDLNDLLVSSNAIISYTDDFGIEFGLVVEDRFSATIENTMANFEYMRDHYFILPEYIRIGENEEPLVCLFGPEKIHTSAEWDEILPLAGEEIVFLPLWYKKDEIGNGADGEHAWVYQDINSHLNHLNKFYTTRTNVLNIAMGSVYPGFLDYYEEGGAGSTFFEIPHNNGSTLDQTIDALIQNESAVDMVQLVTFNDFGEGTMFEPTVETKYLYLEKIQEYTGVVYDVNDLKLARRLFGLRKEYSGNKVVQDSLDKASMYLRNLEMEKASVLLYSYDLSGSDAYLKNAEAQNNSWFHPNPITGGELVIETPEGIESTSLLSIFDVSGRKVYQSFIGKGKGSVKVPDLFPGTYLLTLYNECSVRTGKLIIE